MVDVDLNLLPALEALLSSGSVAGAARRLGLSASAMSRTLARLRMATRDPLLVRAGRSMVLTPRALLLREQVSDVAAAARSLLQPSAEALDLRDLDRIFTIRANDGFVESLAVPLVAAAARQAPGVRLCFAPKPDKDVRMLRQGLVDLEVGVLGRSAGPEIRVQALFEDRFIGVVRRGHPLLDEIPVSAERYVAYPHVVTSRRGSPIGPVDEALSALGLTRRVAVIVPGFPSAMAIARASDLVALVPESYFSGMEATRSNPPSGGLVGFPLPVPTPAITVSQFWHPRMEADPAHRWLRGLFASICRAPRLPRGQR